jgi:uncharacterized protein
MVKLWKHIDPFEGYKGSCEWLPERTIFVTVHGSQAYGTNTPESDIDLKGLAIPPKEYILGFLHNFEQAESNKPYDMVIYGLHKFAKLAAECNPNIIEVLFTDPKHWIVESELFKELYDNRQLFLSRKARFTFSGYAMSQLKRIKSHRSWLLNPPSHKPTRREYGLEEQKKISASELGAMKKLVDDGIKVDSNALKLYHAEQRYQSKLREWKQYQDWKVNRNVKRAGLEARYGFDLKHAGHLVRLLKMSKEILAEGVVNVHRPDAQELLSIRNGAWTYEQLISWAEKAEKEIDVLYKSSDLPAKPNYKKIDELICRLTEKSIKL